MTLRTCIPIRTEALGGRMELDLDRDGRPNGVQGELNYAFRSFDSFLDVGPQAIDALASRCRHAFSARRTRNSSAKYSSGETFWLPAARMAASEPLPVLEQLAKYIFDFHTKDRALSFDPARSGAEWWTQCIDASDEIGLHWDRDYAIEGDCGINVHPHLATVTYLSDVGTPTIVLENAPPLFSADETRPEVVALHVSWPRRGKHIAFDGRWLHGAPDGFPQSRRAPRAGEKRITFLVNVWLNHRPLAAERAHPGAAAGCRRPRRSFHLYRHLRLAHTVQLRAIAHTLQRRRRELADDWVVVLPNRGPAGDGDVVMRVASATKPAQDAAPEARPRRQEGRVRRWPVHSEGPFRRELEACLPTDALERCARQCADPSPPTSTSCSLKLAVDASAGKRTRPGSWAVVRSQSVPKRNKPAGRVPNGGAQ